MYGRLPCLLLLLLFNKGSKKLLHTVEIVHSTFYLAGRFNDNFLSGNEPVQHSKLQTLLSSAITEQWMD